MFGSLVSSPREARADDVEAARRDFAEGVRLYQRGDYEGARRLFKKADSEHHAPSIVYNLAVAEERALRPQAAIDTYEAYLAEAGENGEFSGAAVMAIAQIEKGAVHAPSHRHEAGRRSPVRRWCSALRCVAGDDARERRSSCGGRARQSVASRGRDRGAGRGRHARGLAPSGGRGSSRRASVPSSRTATRSFLGSSVGFFASTGLRK